jgi:hypothetical protein
MQMSARATKANYNTYLLDTLLNLAADDAGPGTLKVRGLLMSKKTLSD